MLACGQTLRGGFDVGWEGRENSLTDYNNAWLGNFKICFYEVLPMLIPPFSKSMWTVIQAKIPTILLHLWPGSKLRTELELEFTSCHVTPRRPHETSKHEMVIYRMWISEF